MMRCPEDTAREMTPEQARAFASYYQDEVGSPSPAKLAAHAATLRNPDGKPGIAVAPRHGPRPR